MELQIKKAVNTDIEEICTLIKNAIVTMESNGIHQWDEVYPAKEDFLADFNDGNLYVGIVEDKIAVVFVLNKCQDEAYFSADWTYTGDKFCIIHRLCVNPEFQNQGIAGQTLKYIEEKLIREGIKAIRLDVFTQNPFALRLYEKAGFSKTGTANWRMGKFILMEKILSVCEKS